MSIDMELALATARLTDRVVAEMYADPFWIERFGERGKSHTQRDGVYHVEYLVQALRADDPRVFVNYAVWLREVLTSRGMCSRHLAENFARLAQAIDEEPWPGRAKAIAILVAGEDALHHRDGDAGAIDDRRSTLANDAGSQLDSTASDDLENHLSYLADALAFADPARFSAYARFMAALALRHGREAAYPAARLAALRSTVSALGTLVSDKPLQILDLARTELESTS